MCEIVVGSVTVYTDLVDKVINPFAVSGQRKVMPAKKSAEVHSILAWSGEL